MRHQLSGRKFNRTSSHRKAMLANMAVSLIMHEQIKTTLPKAKDLRPYVEKLVTIAKNGNGSIASRRMLISRIKNISAAKKLIDIIGKRYEVRSGGYIRIVKSGFRLGDASDMAYIEFVDRDTSAKGVDIANIEAAHKSESSTPDVAK